MKIYQIGNHAISKDHALTLLKKYDESESFHGYKWQGLIKTDTKNIKIIAPPVNMKMLLNLSETDDYHGAELKAYEILYTYLNDAGKNRLEKLRYYEDLRRLDVSDIEQKTAILDQKNNQKRTRIGLI